MENKITWALIIINLIVFLLVFSLPEERREEVFKRFSFSQGTATEVWRWLTSIFLHLSASHVFLNMLGLYFFGKTLEEEVTRQWYLAIYFVSALLGNFVFMFTSPDQVAGASGAVFGVMGAAMFLNPLKRVHLYLFPLPLGLVAILFAIFETIVVVYHLNVGNVANIAHVAGMITGGMFAFFYNPKRSLNGLLVLIISVVLLLVLGPVFGIIIAIGGFIIQIIDNVVGFVLYGIAKFLGFLWV